MVNFTSFLADPTDTTLQTAEFDFNSFESGLGVFQIVEDSFDLGAGDVDAEWLSQSGVDEDVMASHRRGHVVSTFNLRAYDGSATLQNIINSVRTLDRALDRFGVWVHQPPGGDRLFIDYYPSPLVSQFQPGTRSLFRLFRLLCSPDGLPVRIIRRNRMRTAYLDPAVNLCSNGTLAEDHDHDGIPTNWTWDTHTGVTGDTFNWRFGAYQITLSGTTAAHALQQSTRPVTAGLSYTFAFDCAGTIAAWDVWARVEFYDGSNVLIGSAHNGTIPSVLFAPLLGFGRPSVTFTAPTGAVTAKVSMMVQPSSTATGTVYLRGGQLEQSFAATSFRAGYENVSNDVTAAFGKHLWVWGQGNTWALGRLRATPEVGAEAVRLAYSRRSGFRNSQAAMQITDWLAKDSTALLNGATEVADPDAVGGATLQMPSTSTMRPGLRHEIVQTDETSMRGVWKLKASVRVQVGHAYRLQGHYGLGAVDDLPFVMDSKTIDATEPTASEYHIVTLGLFRIPSDSTGLFFELWHQTTDGTSGNVYVDEFWWEPADDGMNAEAVIPGLPAPGTVATEQFLPGDLDTAFAELPDDPGTSDPFVGGTIISGDMVLSDLEEAAAVPAIYTADLSLVAHTFVAEVNVFSRVITGNPVSHGELRVHDLTDDVQVKKAVIKPPKGVQWAQFNVAATFTPVAAHDYLVYVVQTVANSVGNIHLQVVDHSFIPPVQGGTETIAIDADTRRAYVLLDDMFKDDLRAQPPFPKFEPELQLLRLSLGEAADSDWDGTISGETSVKHVSDRTFLAGAGQIPHYTN